MLVGLLGLIGSGKNTVASYLVNNYNFRNESFASSLKDACSVIFDWPRHLLEGDTTESRKWRDTVDEWWSEKLEIPKFTPRLALQLMGTDVLRNHFNENIWFLTVENKIRKNPNQSVVITDVRFPNEIEFIKRSGGILVEVSRGPRPDWHDLAVDANLGNQKSLELMKTVFSNVHYSEWAWAGVRSDYLISNNGSLQDLEDSIKVLINQIKL